MDDELTILEEFEFHLLTMRHIDEFVEKWSKFYEEQRKTLKPMKELKKIEGEVRIRTPYKCKYL